MENIDLKNQILLEEIEKLEIAIRKQNFLWQEPYKIQNEDGSFHFEFINNKFNKEVDTRFLVDLDTNNQLVCSLLHNSIAKKYPSIFDGYIQYLKLNNLDTLVVLSI